jgi:hypothetical protein
MDDKPMQDPGLKLLYAEKERLEVNVKSNIRSRNSSQNEVERYQAYIDKARLQIESINNSIMILETKRNG